MDQKTIIECKHLIPDLLDMVYAGNALNINMKERSMISVLGNGHTGKSLWLKTIAGLHTPLSGDVLLNGRNVSHMDKRSWTESRKRFAYIQVDTALLSAANAIQNIMLPALYHKLGNPSAIREKALKLMEELEVNCDINLLPAYLRKDQRFKIAIARALILDPDALILDSPFSLLDNIGRDALKQFLLNRIKEHNTLVIIKTHDIEFALDHSDQIVFISESMLQTFNGKEELEACNDPEIQNYLNKAY